MDAPQSTASTTLPDPQTPHNSHPPHHLLALRRKLHLQLLCAKLQVLEASLEFSELSPSIAAAVDLRHFISTGHPITYPQENPYLPSNAYTHHVSTQIHPNHLTCSHLPSHSSVTPSTSPPSPGLAVLESPNAFRRSSPSQDLRYSTPARETSANIIPSTFRSSFQTRTYYPGTNRLSELRSLPPPPYPYNPHPQHIPSVPSSSEVEAYPHRPHGYATYRVEGAFSHGMDTPKASISATVRYAGGSYSGGRHIETGGVSSFGFQKRTNFPFRRTYTRETGSPLDMDAINKRVPIGSLAPELRRLVLSGNGFGEGVRVMPESACEEEAMFMVGHDGELVPHVSH